MNRNVLFVLLLAPGVVLADGAPEAKPVASATEAQAPKQDDAKPKTDDAKQKEEDAKQKEEEDVKKKEDPKSLLGISILGNQEAPKALVIVPWKSSELGQSPGISTMLDDSRQPIDKEVFMRMLSYYEIRSGTTRHDGAPVGGRDTAAAEKSDAPQPVTAAHRR
jgi:hypothetical protein